MKNIKYFEYNKLGEDYIVGDIHGHFTVLEVVLNNIGFNPLVDRLFSVGDLVDRGPDSNKVVEWLKKPWFHAVRGNHEQMAIDFFPVARCHVTSDEEADYIFNGGFWFLKLSKAEQKIIVDEFKKLPYLIELETKNKTIGIVHAEEPYDDWRHTVRQVTMDPLYLADKLLWARDRFRTNDPSIVEHIDQVIVGHTPVKKIVNLGNVMYIDKGVYNVGTFSIIRASDLVDVNT